MNYFSYLGKEEAFFLFLSVNHIGLFEVLVQCLIFKITFGSKVGEVINLTLFSHQLIYYFFNLLEQKVR